MKVRLRLTDDRPAQPALRLRGWPVERNPQTQKLMVRSVARRVEVLLCGTCMDARGLTDKELLEGARRSTMDELAELTIAADRVLVF